MTNTRRYIFTGMRNARDLGGYPAAGGITRFGVFLRSDLPRDVTETDKALLRRVGVTADLDLRDKNETGPMPDELAGDPAWEYRIIPMLGVAEAAARREAGGHTAFEEPFFWGREYVRMMENNRPWAVSALEYLAGTSGAALFHCFTGKDRTGLLAALLLGLCGVSDEDIAADYSVSQLYLGDVYRWMTEHLPDFHGQPLSSPFFSTAAENILTVQRHFHTEYGGTSAFLAECGLSGAAAEALRAKLIKRT